MRTWCFNDFILLSSLVIMGHRMALDNASRSAFAAPGHPTLADLIARVEAASELPKSTRQNWCWALRTVARVAHMAPPAIPAHPDFLRRLMRKATPPGFGTRHGSLEQRSIPNRQGAEVGRADQYPRPLLPGTLQPGVEEALRAPTAEVRSGLPAFPVIPLLQRQRHSARGIGR